MALQGGRVLFTGLLVIMITSIVCSAVATDVNIELIDEGYDFIPNMVRVPRPEAAATTPSSITSTRRQKNRLRRPSEVSSSSNPVDRFVSAIVSRQSLQRVSEKLAKTKAADKEREQDQAAKLAAQKQQDLLLKQKIAHLQAMAKAQAGQTKELEQKSTVSAASAEHAALATASEKAHKVAEIVHMPAAAPLVHGQGAAVNSVKSAMAHETSSPPPLDGISDMHSSDNPSSHLHTLHTDQTNIQYDVAKAEASAERSENRLLAQAAREYELGQSLHYESDDVDHSLVLLDVPTTKTDQTVAKISEMKTLIAELSKTVDHKSGEIAAIQKEFVNLKRHLSKVKADQHIVTIKSLELGGQASTMLSQELGEARAAQDAENDLGEDASTDSDDLQALSARMSSIDSTVSQLGDEENVLVQSAKKHAAEKNAKVAARQVAIRKQHKVQERSHKYELQQEKLKEAEKHQDANLLAQEARLRMTTVAEVEAESHLAAALAAKRKHEAMHSKKMKPTTRMNAYDVNREMYKRMYLQNAEEQATQAKVDLQNKLSDVRETDEQHLKEGLLQIKDHKAGIKAALHSAYKLRASLEEDQELGETMDSTRPLQAIKSLQQTQQNAITLEREVTNQAKVLMNKVQSIQAYNEGVAGLAHTLLKNVPTSFDTKLQADIGSSSMKLQLHLGRLKQVDSKAMQMAAALRAVQTEVEHAHMHEHIAKHHLTQVAHVLHRVNNGVAQETATLELSTKIRRSEVETQLQESRQEEVELGESGGSTPITAQMNWESQQLAKAQSDLQEIHTDAPNLINKQVAADKQHLDKIMQVAQQDLDREERKFKRVGESISPNIDNEQRLQEALNQEQDRKDRYAQQLSFVAHTVKLVAKAERSASNDIDSALDHIREQCQ